MTGENGPELGKAGLVAGGDSSIGVGPEEVFAAGVLIAKLKGDFVGELAASG